MDGWQRLGDAIGGMGSAREDAYRKRLGDNYTLGIRGENMRQERMKSDGLMTLGDALVALGYEQEQAQGMATIGRAGLNPEHYTGARGDLALQAARQRAEDAAVAGDWGRANAAMLHTATGPVDVTKITDGTAYNRLVAPSVGEMLTTDVGQATIRQRNAAAGAHGASAAAAMGRLGIAQAQFDLQRRGLWNPDG